MARTITEQTGWKRNHPNMICQNTDVLESVNEYNFDLNNPDFIRYFTNRTGVVLDNNHPELHHRHLLTPAPRLELLQQVCAMNDEEYLLSPLLVQPYDVTGKLKPKSEWRIIPSHERNLRAHRILRGKLQDCWELFNRAN